MSRASVGQRVAVSRGARGGGLRLTIGKLRDAFNKGRFVVLKPEAKTPGSRQASSIGPVWKKQIAPIRERARTAGWTRDQLLQEIERETDVYIPSLAIAGRPATVYNNITNALALIASQSTREELERRLGTGEHVSRLLAGGDARAAEIDTFKNFIMPRGAQPNQAYVITYLNSVPNPEVLESIESFALRTPAGIRYPGTTSALLGRAAEAKAARATNAIGELTKENAGWVAWHLKHAATEGSTTKLEYFTKSGEVARAADGKKGGKERKNLLDTAQKIAPRFFLDVSDVTDIGKRTSERERRPEGKTLAASLGTPIRGREYDAGSERFNIFSTNGLGPVFFVLLFSGVPLDDSVTGEVMATSNRIRADNGRVAWSEEEYRTALSQARTGLESAPQVKQERRTETKTSPRAGAGQWGAGAGGFTGGAGAGGFPPQGAGGGAGFPPQAQFVPPLQPQPSVPGAGGFPGGGAGAGGFPQPSGPPPTATVAGAPPQFAGAQGAPPSPRAMGPGVGAPTFQPAPQYQPAPTPPR